MKIGPTLTPSLSDFKECGPSLPRAPALRIPVLLRSPCSHARWAWGTRFPQTQWQTWAATQPLWEPETWLNYWRRCCDGRKWLWKATSCGPPSKGVILQLPGDATHLYRNQVGPQAGRGPLMLNATRPWRTSWAPAARADPSLGSYGGFLILPHTRRPFPIAQLLYIWNFRVVAQMPHFSPVYIIKEKKREDSYFWNRSHLLQFILQVSKSYLGWTHYLRKSVRRTSFWTLA